jgi:hypothetical protein
MNKKEPVINIETEFKGVVDLVTRIADVLLQTATLEPGDKETMTRLAAKILNMVAEEPIPPDPGLMGLICLQVGCGLLMQSPNYEISEFLENSPCPDDSPLN